MAAVEVIRAAPVEPPIEEVVLRLTPEEAAAVGVALGACAAKPPFYPIYQTLDEAGYGYTDPNTERYEGLRRKAGIR